MSFAAHTIIHLNKRKIKSIFSLQTLILTSAFLVSLTGVAYSPYKAQAFTDLERQLAIFLFPILISASSLNLAVYRNRLLKIFGFTCSITVLYLFIHAFRVILYNHSPLSYMVSTFLTNHNFSAPIQMHATYLSMYVSLSLIIFIYFFLEEKIRINKLLYATCILILVAGLVQLASRSVFIATIFIIALYPVFIQQRAIRMKFLMLALPIMLAALISIYNIDALKRRYTVELRNDLTQASINNEIIEPRMARWQIAWQLFRHSPLIGYGSGTEKRILMENYFDKRFYNSYLHKLNAHNQYLSIMLKTGIWGLLIFLFVLTYGYLLAWQNRDVLFAAFITLIAFVSFSENILDVNKTIFFYSFFFSLFIYSSRYTPSVAAIFKVKKNRSLE